MENIRVEYKTCTNPDCIVKHYPETEEFFYTMKYKRKDGTISTWLTAECKTCSLARVNKYQDENPEKVKATKKQNSIKNAENINAYTKQWKLDNAERWKKYFSGWQKANPEKVKANNKIYFSKLIRLIGQEWANCKNYFNDCCAYCGKTWEQNKLETNKDLHKEHADHNGENNLTNCIPACNSCNSKKHDFEFEDWFSISNPIFSKRRYNRIIKWLTKDCFQYIEARRKRKK